MVSRLIYWPYHHIREVRTKSGINKFSKTLDLFQKMYCLAGTAYFRNLIKTPEEIRNSCLEFAIKCGFKINEEGIELVSKNMCYCE